MKKCVIGVFFILIFAVYGFSMDNKSYFGTDYERYYNDELIVNQLPKSLQKYGFKGFCKKIKKYKDESWPYEQLVGQRFHVLDFIDDPSKDENFVFFKMENTETLETVYFKYNKKRDFDFPFISERHMESIKEEWLGKKFYIQGKNWLSEKEIMRDMFSNNEVKDFEKGKCWTCVDVSIAPVYFSISLILENAYGEKIPLPIDSIKTDKWVLTEDQYNAIENKKIEERKEYLMYFYDQGFKSGEREPDKMSSAYRYAKSWGEDPECVDKFIEGYEDGQKKFFEYLETRKDEFTEREYQAIKDEKIFLGMGEEALLLSWGKPKDINRTVSATYISKQYVYKGDYDSYTFVYVENGKITSWQD